MDVSIILVNYNTRKMTSECIDSIICHTSALSYEIIVVDNASIDGSKEIFERDTRIRYIYNTCNEGFGKANNRGIRIAKGNYILFLNTDTLLLNNACKYFFDYEEENGRNIVLGSWLLDRDGKVNHSYGLFPTKRNEMNNAIRVFTSRIPFWRKNIGYVESYVDGNLDVEYVSGADMFVPSNILKENGLFDERFFMYYEESDLQRRMADNGVVRRIIQGPRIVHFEQGSQSGFIVPKKSMDKLILTTTSMLIYTRKYSNFVSFGVFKYIYLLLRIPAMCLNEYPWRDKIRYFKVFLN